MTTNAPNPVRRAFLRGRVRVQAHPLRPPWAHAELSFVDACTRCGDCLAACPEKILVAADGGFPEIDFTRGGCTFCGECVSACAAGALSREASTRAIVARVDDGCLAGRGVHCQSCRDVCEPEAVRFEYRHSVPVPQIDFDACSGCGACVASCPADAISMIHAEAA